MHISFLKKKKIVEWICGNGIAEIRGKKKLLQLVCGNAIAKIREGICGNCDNTIAKNGRKKNSGCRNLGMN